MAKFIVKTYQNIIGESVMELSHLENPKFEAESLLAFVLQCNRSRIIAFPEKKIEHDQYVQYANLVKQRASGMPFAYLTGEKEFYDLTLKVTPATLVPRADTELLVETALSKMQGDDSYKVIDMGTGSGAIALTLKKHRPNAKVIAVDQSLEALSVAQDNGERLSLDVEFIQSDWFSNVKGHDFDLIVSNPPYIEEHDEHLVEDGVRYEPITALVAGDNGYSDLFHLIKTSWPLLKEDGWLMMEHGFEQGEKLRTEFTKQGYQNVATLKDLGKNDRITIGQK
ncbi:peptide chain release factor N(5)-glutamine methyltransferase [Wohlfahrtiimonas larvae]|uniref:Release factor glutamine methyltransferase n=1 Tax=Wohlfahrtiimonas larvae TaxID=1157986 RepID=A0ABP9MY03_9GAMM|nr:peptide chain release factor N(5)-glutamine methyltransferase [Wohlfahrtiimonas larvae]